MVRDSLRAWDWVLFGSASALTAVSVIAMMSASATLNPELASRQGMWALIGIAVSIAVARLPFGRWVDAAPVAFGISIALLAFVLLGGTARLGATRWISLFGLSVQPVELAKLTGVWWISRYLSDRADSLEARTLLTSLGVVGVAALLVFIQPDLGSATVLLAIWFGMVWAAGMVWRHLAVMAGACVGLLPLAWYVLKPYQRARLTAFVDPHADPLGAGYTIIQSQIAIGSGGWTGRGWFAGTQNQLNFLPERHSDFLFSVIGEEWGLLGCVLVLGLVGLLLFRTLTIAARSSSPQGRLVAVGVCSWIGYQAFVNMGMVMGLLPVVGIPFPLLSYGGSSMVMVWAAIGFVQRVHLSEQAAGRRVEGDFVTSPI